MLLTATAFTLLSGLSPDIRRNSYLASFENLDYISIENNCNITTESILRDVYLKSNDNKLLKNVPKYLEDECVNKDVQINVIKIIENLSKIYIDNIHEDNVYVSGYGTVLMDFEKDKYIFSLEIGTKSIGYFSEIDSETNDFCEEASIEDDSFNISVGKLNTDFINFYNRI